MALETGGFISDLIATNPASTDPKSQGDDHIRLIKAAVKATFPNVSGAVTPTHTELNLLDGVTASTAELNILDGVTATAAELNVLDGITATVTELNCTDGVTSAIQTQLDAKSPLASPTFTGTPAAPTATSGTSTTQVATTEFVQSTAFNTALPAQNGNANKLVTTDGANASWGATLDQLATGYTLAGGTTPKTLTVDDDLTTSNAARKNAQQVFTKPQRPSLQAETAPTANAITWDLTDDTVYQLNLDANVTTFNLTGTLASLLGYQYQILVRYNGGTSIAWNAAFKFPGAVAPTLTGTSGKLDVFNFVVASTDGGTTCYLLNTGSSQNMGA